MFVKATLSLLVLIAIISQAAGSYSGGGMFLGNTGWHNQNVMSSFQQWRQQHQPIPRQNTWRLTPQRTWGDMSDSDSDSGGYIVRAQPNPFYAQNQPRQPPYIPPQPVPVPQPDPFYNQNQPPVVTPRPVYVPPVRDPVPILPIPVPDYGIEPETFVEIKTTTIKPFIVPEEIVPEVIIDNGGRIPPTTTTTTMPTTTTTEPTTTTTEPTTTTTEPTTTTTEPTTTTTTTTLPTTTLDLSDIPNRGDSPFTRSSSDNNDGSVGDLFGDIGTSVIFGQALPQVGQDPNQPPEPTNDITPDNYVGQDPTLDQQILNNVFGSVNNNVYPNSNQNQNPNQDQAPTPSPEEVQDFINALYSSGNPFAMNTGTPNNGPTRVSFGGPNSADGVAAQNKINAFQSQGFVNTPPGKQYAGLNPFIR